MTIFNRIVMLVLSLALFAFGATTFLLLTGLVAPRSSYLRAILALYFAWRAAALLGGATGNIAALLALGMAAIGFVLVVLELLPLGRLVHRRETEQYIVRQDTMGQVALGRSMVRDLVQHVAETTPGVVHAEPTVKNRADGLHLSTRASLVWDADAPAVGKLLQERIKESVQTLLGLPVAEVRVIAQTTPAIKEQRRRVA